MNPSSPKPLPLLPSAIAVGAVTLVVFAAIIVWVTFTLRDRLREDIASRDAQAIHALAQMEYRQVQSGLPTLPDELQTQFELSEVILNVSLYEGIIGVALLSTDGEIVERIPADLSPATGASANIAEPLSRYEPTASLARTLPDMASPETIPLLEVWVPLLDPLTGSPVATGYFLLDGTSIRSAYRSLDRELLRQAWIAFGAGAVLIGGVLAVIFRRLFRAQRELESRTRALIEANSELNLAIKSAALGGLTAHLLHDLKNPISGLQMFVEEAKSLDGKPIDPATLEYAMEHTQRLRNLVQEVVGILQEDHSGIDYSLTLDEWLESFRHKVEPPCRENRMPFETGPVPAHVRLSNRQANLLNWILYSLVQNAIEASSPGNAIQLEFRRDVASLRIHVRDHGTGLGEEARANLFQPQKSRKPEGSGIGLAISSHLARALDASISLVETGPTGTCFEVRVPLEDPVTISSR